MTPLGSWTKICQRSPPGTWRESKFMLFEASRCFMPSKPRLAKATWWTTPESGFCGSEVGEISTRCTTGFPSLYIQAPEGEIRPGAFFEAQHVLVEADCLGQIPGPDVEMVEDANAHAAQARCHAFAP